MVEAPIERVCFLYSYRWTIEILFRWLKHTLGLAHLVSHSPNGIMMQVVATLLVYALLILYHQDGPLSLKQILRELRYQVHERLYQLGYEQGVRDVLAQRAAGTA
jgi:IS4 transposase